ncbi:MAG: YkgJ family cysteine cluster protein [Desulfobacteraceae bacterium]|nr:YkgJ family cysteine cluster protein [Desulfobacteraceae bacterium]
MKDFDYLPAAASAATPLERPYFFDAGLRFECQRCGVCCTGAPGTIYMGPDEIDLVAGHCQISRQQFIATYLYPFKDSYSLREDDQGRCLFFNAGCTIYEVRPLQCRSFPFWFSNLRSPARWARLRQDCPGIGRGRLYSKEEIMAWARQTEHFSAED